MSEEKVGIKETKEVLIALMQLSAILAESFKDGVQAHDFAEIIVKFQANPELQAKFMAAYSDINKIPSEVKDIDVAEGIDLVIALLPEIKNLINVIKAPKAV